MSTLGLNVIVLLKVREGDYFFLIGLPAITGEQPFFFSVFLAIMLSFSSSLCSSWSLGSQPSYLRTRCR
jgi:hypothetical protein